MRRQKIRGGKREERGLEGRGGEKRERGGG